MSWRYWSKAVEGDERKIPLDLLSPVVCIRLLVETLWTDVPGWRAPFCWTRRITTGALSRQQPRFMPLSDRCVFGLRSGCGGYNGDSDQNDRSDNHPGLRNADQKCGDRQADNENDESDQVGAERGHDSSWFGFSWLESSKRRAGKSNCAGSLQLQLFFFPLDYRLVSPSQRVGATESLGTSSTSLATSVALPQWRPKRAASLQSGFQMSRVAPSTLPPVSSTR